MPYGPTFGPQRKQPFLTLYEKEGDNKYNAFDKDIAVVHFFFQEPSVFQFKRAQSMTWIGFISQMGGLLGLFLGFSLISGIELLYWFSMRLVHRLCYQPSQTKPMSDPTPRKVPPLRNSSAVSHFPGTGSTTSS